MSEDRIQKILARAGVASRRAAEELIEAGRVTVNGTRATLGDKADPQHDAIKVDGKRIHPRTEYHYLLLNKPRAVMSTRHDPEGRPTVMDLVPPGHRKALVPVGRLDFLTEGLILLTDDGDLAHRVAHPRYGCTKTYEVKVRGTPEERTLDRLRRGLPLEGKRTAPAGIEARSVPGESENSWWTVELSEGRTRQIREMFKRVGHPVMKLRRVAIGPLRDAALPLGAVRELSDKEVEMLRRSTRGGGGSKAGTAKGGEKTKTSKGKGPGKGGRSDRGAAGGRGSGATGRGGKAAGGKAGAGKAFGGKTSGSRKSSGGAAGKPSGGKPGGAKPGGAKPGGAKPGGGKPGGGRPGGAKPGGRRPGGAGGAKPGGRRPGGAGSPGGRPGGGRSGKPARRPTGGGKSGRGGGRS